MSGGAAAMNGAAVAAANGGSAPGADPAAATIFMEPTNEVVVQFNNISCWVPRLDMGKKGLLEPLKGLVKPQPAVQTKADMRQVLFNISGECEPGTLLALMGPSGGGKTTLLSILGGRAPKQTRQEGQILFNGHKLTKRVKRQIGFVLQDDLLYATLSVHETLFFAAMLRLPKHKTKAEKLERVDNVIKALGLERCRDTIIGDHLRRGVSGGERKRVSVGHELLINPSILLLDEPTSGLDSSAARKLLMLLRELASSGRAIITTIHQPSSFLYSQLDAVLLLSQGHPIYYGKGSEAAPWFAHLGVPCPFGVNIADWILDLASGEVAGKHKTGEDMRQHLVTCSEQFLQQEPSGYAGGAFTVPALTGEAPLAVITADGTAGDHLNGDAHGGSLVKRKGGLAPVDIEQGLGNGPSPHSSKGNLDGLDRSATTVAADRMGASRWGASYWTQFYTLFVRAVRVRRFETLSRQDLIQFIVVGAICGMIWWQVGQDKTVYGAQNSRGLLFFEGLFLAFRCLFSSLFVFPQEHKMMLKERSSGMYRLSAFYLARTASDIPSDLSIPSLFIVIIYLMGGLRHGGYFFLNWLTVLLTTLVAQSFGLFLGATVMNAKTAQTIAAVIMLTFMLVGGFYVTNIPVWIGWIKWLSFLTYTFSLLMKIEYKGQSYWDCSLGGDNSFNPSDPWNYVTSGQCAPEADLNKTFNTSIDINGAPWEAAVLVGFLVLGRIAVYIALRKKTQR
ncbi:hypothetical protein ABPG77_002492 [Micractinium sp. CCAP 211/92]